MVRLKHLSNERLELLEAEVSKIKSSIVLVGVNYVGTKWYAHFLVQEVFSDNLKTREELGLSVQSSLPKKKGKL